jgi:hypothetical protein
VTDRLVIIADDLTGAADAAAAYGPFAEVAVVLRPVRGPALHGGARGRHGQPSPVRRLSRVPGLGELPLVTKAGAFGEPATLDRARRVLHDRATERTTIHYVAQERRCTMARHIVAITMGDAAGVGPEVIVKALAENELFQACRRLVIGDAARLRNDRHHRRPARGACGKRARERRLLGRRD